MFKKTVLILFIFILSGCILIVGEPNASIKAVLDKEKNEVVLYFSKPYVSDKESEIKVDSVNYPFEKNDNVLCRRPNGGR